MSFSAYLVGSWERRHGIQTTIQIINPTLRRLEVTVAALDNDGNFLACEDKLLGKNDMWEILIPEFAGTEEFGVVKAISHSGSVVTPGIVGFQRHFLVIPSETEAAFSESPLAAIPNLDDIWIDEFTRFRGSCP